MILNPEKDAVMEIAEDIFYAGVNDHKVDLFEGQYPVPNGMSYNSYVIMDEKIAVMDTADRNFTHEWLDNVQKILSGRAPDYLVLQHMEPDHAANAAVFMELFPQAKIVTSAKAVTMIQNFFGKDYPERRIVVGEGDTLPLGKHTLAFVTAPMVHWPEVIVTYDACTGTLFSADGFGKFGALDREESWDDGARRYFIGIVGKYGAQVQSLLKKAAALDIARICPLHGPVLTENLGHYLELYNIWSSYAVESEGIFIACTSVYGHTRDAVLRFAEMLKANGCPSVTVTDLARCDMTQAVANAFRYGKIVLATTTYNADIYPFMRDFITRLTERNFQNRTVGFIENGSWAPLAAKTMRDMLSKSKNLVFAENTVTIRSCMNEESKTALAALADELCGAYKATQKNTVPECDFRALFNIGYGLYVVTCNDGKQDNGLIVNTVSQVTSTPNQVAVTINKQNYSHHVIQQTGVMNLNCLSTEAGFDIFERFGFHSGRNTDKFAGLEFYRSANHLAYLPRCVNAFLSLKVGQYVDLGTHGMFICSITEARVISRVETMTYNYYQANVKPKPRTAGKKGFVCKICGYVYEGDTLPPDFICPLCKHGAADFEPIR